ncbi:hypothetical protein FXB70_09100 [Aggregatibacter actinomycetemcomitans]|nr:hypothetical protein SC1000_09945 [Aggregatibacter actinomycetemcomitans]TYA22568.1 hypothetical protein FXB91_09590 [Aggregatibacter actinomycetemcomitans]TYA26494.1 hypothetical protein FXB92_09325 [Aggregatibacter actinomycetemcomitans]TYA28418.1 hypothetical protein FXB96_09035 [Aggregatibacter actinomycetemcomitans]TYA36177.1 hypothetical protein FXE06_09445 [Aggregatibacter actinomycetemcomitans]
MCFNLALLTFLFYLCYCTGFRFFLCHFSFLTGKFLCGSDTLNFRLISINGFFCRIRYVVLHIFFNIGFTFCFSLRRRLIIYLSIKL